MSDVVDGFCVVRPVDQHGGSGVLHDPGHLGVGEPPIDGDADRTDQCAPEEDFEELDAVSIQEGHPLASNDAIGCQRGGHLFRPFVERTPGNRLVAKREHGCVRLPRCPVAEHRRGRSGVVHVRVSSGHLGTIPRLHR